MTTPEPGSVNVPANLTVSIFTVLGWIGSLDMVIAVELDAGRPAVAKRLARMRNDMAEMANLTRVLEDPNG